MPLDKILEYQKIDTKIFILDKDFRASKESQKLQYYYAKYRENKDALEKVNNDAKEAMKAFGNNLQKAQEAEGLEKYIDEDLSKIDDLSDLDLYNKSLAEYEQYITTLERQVNKLTKRLSDIKSMAMTLQGSLRELRARTMSQKREFDAKQKEIAEQARPYLIELRKLQQDIDPAIMKKYLALRKERKMPAFVEYADGNCTGCGIHIEIEVEHKLQKKGDYAECPECRRIVYKP